jgi:hypothetical protein
LTISSPNSATSSPNSATSAEEVRLRGEMLQRAAAVAYISNSVRLHRLDGRSQDKDSAIVEIQKMADALRQLDEFLEDFGSLELSEDGYLIAEAIDAATSRFWDLFDSHDLALLIAPHQPHGDGP